jgi:hypothetical protein
MQLSIWLGVGLALREQLQWLLGLGHCCQCLVDVNVLNGYQTVPIPSTLYSARI